MSKGIGIQVENAADLPVLQADRERILQVLRNFLANAVKFTPEKGQITLTARNGDDHVEVRVVDTGCGIPAENISTIFEKFYQGPVMGSSKIKGTGLGLALARHIVTAHGGKVWAESELGHGSAFIFVLPA
jgi:two-component system, NtrC family, sensor histidine kinase GlrK